MFDVKRKRTCDENEWLRATEPPCEDFGYDYSDSFCSDSLDLVETCLEEEAFFEDFTHKFKNLAISNSNLTIFTDLKVGHGAYGDVYEAEYNGEKVAFKALKPCTKLEQSFYREVEAMQAIRSPSVTKLIGVSDKALPGVPYGLILQWMENGNLQSVLKKHTLSNYRKICIALDIAMGLASVHSSGFVHRDVTTTNVLLDDKFSAHLSDFGLAKRLPVKDPHILMLPNGNPFFMAPECACVEPFYTPADMFGFGVVLYELFTGTNPLQQLGRRASRELLSSVDLCIASVFPYCDAIPPKVYAIVEKCLQRDPEVRPSAQLVYRRLYQLAVEEGEGDKL